MLVDALELTAGFMESGPASDGLAGFQPKILVDSVKEFKQAAID